MPERKWKELSYYMNLKYLLEVKTMPDGMYCAEIKAVPGLCAYGESVREAVEQLEIVKKTAFELMLAQGKKIPMPTIRPKTPIDMYEKWRTKKKWPNSSLYNQATQAPKREELVADQDSKIMMRLKFTKWNAGHRGNVPAWLAVNNTNQAEDFLDALSRALHPSERIEADLIDEEVFVGSYYADMDGAYRSGVAS